MVPLSKEHTYYDALCFSHLEVDCPYVLKHNYTRSIHKKYNDFPVVIKRKYLNLIVLVLGDGGRFSECAPSSTPFSLAPLWKAYRKRWGLYKADNLKVSSSVLEPLPTSLPMGWLESNTEYEVLYYNVDFSKRYPYSSFRVLKRIFRRIDFLRSDIVFLSSPSHYIYDIDYAIRLPHDIIHRFQ